MSGEGDRELREVLRRWRGMKLAARSCDADTSPGCIYGVMTRDAMSDLSADVEDVKAELKWIRATIVATIVTAAVGTLVRLAGW